MNESPLEQTLESLERLLAELRGSLESRTSWTAEQESKIDDGLERLRDLVADGALATRGERMASGLVLSRLQGLRREAWLSARLAHSRLLYERWLSTATQSATTYGAKGALIPEEIRKALAEV